jgi:Fic/DOC family N-terminal
MAKSGHTSVASLARHARPPAEALARWQEGNDPARRRCPTPATLTLSQGTYNSVAKAHLALGRLDFAARRLPDPRLLVRPVLRREAQTTSELEGTYAPLDEVFAADFIDEGRRNAEPREATLPGRRPEAPTSAIVSSAVRFCCKLEEFEKVSEDRHNPLPHIALSTTALTSAYRKMASMATYPSAELREL